MKRYLIAQYFPGAGQTEENPSCYFGTGSYVLPNPLPEYVKENYCYKTRSAAERYAMKCNLFYTYSRFSVIEILV
jgi:hypothetical protein